MTDSANRFCLLNTIQRDGKSILQVVFHTDDGIDRTKEWKYIGGRFVMWTPFQRMPEGASRCEEHGADLPKECQ